MFKLTNSTRKNKKYMLITPDNKKIHFGAFGMSDFTLNKDPKRKELYLNRHKKLEEKYWVFNLENL
tara:strand:+ start:59 stop:256 length:198 start_codon:yes stop_codon:yes gene_type:complete